MRTPVLTKQHGVKSSESTSSGSAREGSKELGVSEELGCAGSMSSARTSEIKGNHGVGAWEQWGVTHAGNGTGCDLPRMLSAERA